MTKHLTQLTGTTQSKHTVSTLQNLTSMVTGITWRRLLTNAQTPPPLHESRSLRTMVYWAWGSNRPWSHVSVPNTMSQSVLYNKKCNSSILLTTLGAFSKRQAKLALQWLLLGIVLIRSSSLVSSFDYLYVFFKSGDYVFKMSVFKKLSIVLFDLKTN